MDAANTTKSPGYRAAMAAVIILSGLLLVGVIALVAGFARQYRLMHADAPQQAAAVPSAVSLTLGPGAHIVSASSDAGKLILHVATPSGSEVDVMDLGTGKLTAQVKDGPH